MRKSNKILLGAFLAFVVMILAIHFTLYAKYSSGDFVNKRVEKVNNSKVQEFPGVTNLTVASLENLEIRFADTLKVETDKTISPELKISAANGTLTITGGNDTSSNTNGERIRARTYDRVIVFLPASVAAQINFSEVTVYGYPDSSKKAAHNFSLVETRLNLRSLSDEKTDYVAGLNITASNKSEVNIFNMRIDELKASLRDSKFSENGFDIKSIAIEADDASRLNLSGANLRKLKP